MLLLLAVSLLSAAVIAYEILLTQLFAITLWHHFAYMVISLALLGYGASGTFLVFVRQRRLARFGASFAALAVSFGLAAIGCYALAWRLPFNPLEVIWDWRQQFYLAAMYLLLAPPFFAAGSAIGLSLAARPAQINAIYRSDLTGAGTGALGIVLAMFALPPEDCLRIVAAIGFVAAAFALASDGWQRAPLALAVIAVPAALAWPATWLKPMPSPYKGLSLALTVPETRVIAERNGPLGRLSVIESPSVPLRHAPGLSLATKLAPPEQLGVFTDGDGLSVMTRFTGDFKPLGYLDQQITALPFHLLDRPATLVLGAGGGAEVLQALYHRASRTDAVELNRQIGDLANREFGEFTGHIYGRPEVSLHVAEARGFVAGSRRRWDLIQLALLDSYAASAAGVLALSESPIYTIEALQAYLDHLNPDGLVAITRWLGNPPRDTVKLFATAIAALEADVGTSPSEIDPGERLALLHGWNTATLLVKNGRFTRDEIANLRSFAAERQFDVAWYPGMGGDEANHYNRLAKPTLYDAAVALLGPGRAAFLADYRFNIWPATDDRPFFFRFFGWSLLPQLAALRGQGGLVFVDTGYLVIVLALLQAVIASHPDPGAARLVAARRTKACGAESAPRGVLFLADRFRLPVRRDCFHSPIQPVSRSSACRSLRDARGLSRLGRARQRDLETRCYSLAAGGGHPGRHCHRQSRRRLCNGATSPLRPSHRTPVVGEDRRCCRPSRPFGVRHGSAISARAQSCLRLVPGSSTVGLGHQRLRVGRGGCDGQPARDACRVHHRAGSCSQPLHGDAAPARAGPARGVSVQGGRAAREGLCAHRHVARELGTDPRQLHRRLPVLGAPNFR